MRFKKKAGAAKSTQGKAVTSPLQKKGWGKTLGFNDATDALTDHVRRGADWSGNPELYLSALSRAMYNIATEKGLVWDDE